MKENILFYKCILGWYILLTQKVTKGKNEFCLKVWKPLKHKNLANKMQKEGV